MRICIVLVLLMLLMLACDAVAQEEAFVPQGVEIIPELDVFGQEVLFAEGELLNQSETAYSDVSLTAAVYDAGGEIVGEGFGYLVNACGAALLADFTLQPGQAQPFAVALELYETDAEFERVEVTAQGSPTDAAPPAPPGLLPGITRVSEREVARVEWADGEQLRFGAGCWRDPFTALDWYEYNVRTGVQQRADHPQAERVTEALLRQLGLLEPLYYNHSFLSYAPNARRMVYQTEINTVITAEPDGSFKRVLFEDLSNRSLQGFTWLDDGRFLAYYYGAYGDPVAYFTASVDGQVLSEPAPNVPPSLIVPGASPDGTRIIIALEVDGQTGYYLKLAAFPTTELLFEAEPPGNNWPGPIYERDSDGAAFIYAALPVDGEARLTCFNLQTRELHDLTRLPLQLATDERAIWALAPDMNTIALAADGINGGLWLVELDALPSCE